jgi:hypothetical protein
LKGRPHYPYLNIHVASEPTDIEVFVADVASILGFNGKVTSVASRRGSLSTGPHSIAMIVYDPILMDDIDPDPDVVYGYVFYITKHLSRSLCPTPEDAVQLAKSMFNKLCATNRFDVILEVDENYTLYKKKTNENRITSDDEALTIALEFVKEQGIEIEHIGTITQPLLDVYWYVQFYDKLPPNIVREPRELYVLVHEDTGEARFLYQ